MIRLVHAGPLLVLASSLWAAPALSQSGGAAEAEAQEAGAHATGAPGAPALGATEFANSGAAEAQAPFLRGLLLLHSFEYADARDAFREAREIDPSFGMAAWGEAMTHNHPVWQRQDKDAAWAALNALWQDADGQPRSVPMTEREGAYMRTLEVLFGEGDKRDRDDAYAEAMHELAAAYPDDLDAQTFYALALLGTAHEGRDTATYMRAAAVLEEAFAANPQHPGAAHYLIHAYDDPVHAPLGLRPARVYAGVAPAASHALHMPSHIWLALGMWDDVAEMNRRSYRAAAAGSARRGAPLNGHGWHALWWWHYAELQTGDTAEARRLLSLARELAAADPDGSTAQAHLTRIRAQHAVATEDGGVLDPAPAEGSLATFALDRFTDGHFAIVGGDVAAGIAMSEELARRLAAADDPPWQARVADHLLRASIAFAGAQTAEGVAELEAAAAIESAAPLTFGPPAPPRMAHEYLGSVLLASDPARAAAAFEAALARAPNRRFATQGLRRARAALSEAAAGAPDLAVPDASPED